ncbi:MAG: CDP-glucose 4,6-dehydratase [Caldimonas sp.]
MKRDAPFDALTLRGPFDDLFGGAYLGRRVLVTGHTGFKGSWLALWLQALGADVCGLALAPPEGPNHLRLLGLAMDEALVDLRNAAAVRAALACYRPEIVFHLAAQPLVRRSYREPAATFDVNVMGLVHLLEAVRETPSVKVVVNVTSDKCYLNRETAQGYREDDALGGHDPYSASKACAEIVSASYRSSFLAGGEGRGHAVALATARAGNVIGGGDWSEDRLVPDLVRSATSGEATAIRSPHSTRPWQHVLEPLAGYLLLGERLLADPQAAAEAWNFGPDASGQLSVAQVIVAFARCWPAVRCAIDRTPQPHEASLLHLDAGKARERLGWRPVWDADTAIARTAGWYRHHHERGELRSRDDLARYVADARLAGVGWAPARLAVAA